MNSDMCAEVTAKPNKRVVTYLTEAEYEAFLRALRKSGRYHSMSDALRDFIRDFVDSQGVTVGRKEKREGVS